MNYADSVEEVEDIAAFWLVRLESPGCTSRDRATFEEWRRTSGLHEEAYQRLRRGNEAMERLLGDPEILAMAAAARAETEASLGRKSVYRFSAMAASLIIFIGISILLLAPRLAGDEPLQIAEARPIGYETAVGERSTITLADGTEVTLNTDSRVEVSYSPEQRTIDLTRGQAYFVVARGQNRPFVVDAGDKRVVALGTAFDVHYRPNGSVEVTLVEGKVQIYPRPQTSQSVLVRESPMGESIVLQPGERLLASREAVPEVVTANVATDTSWRTGKIVFRDRPLDEVVDELNRYSAQKIVLSDDPRVAQLEVSGVFATGRASTFVTALEAMHPVAGERAASNEVTLVWAE